MPDEIVHIRQAFIAVTWRSAAGVLDGWPRTMDQASEMYKLGLELGMAADVVLHPKVDDEEAMRRLLARGATDPRS